MRTKLLPLLLIPVLLLGACSGGGDEKFPDVAVVTDDQVTPIIANSEIVVGTNRMVFGLLGPDQQLMIDAGVHLVFYQLSAAGAEKRFEVDAESHVPARDANLTEQLVHIHPDGTQHVHLNAGDDVGFYTATVDFDKAGDWGVEMQVRSFQPKFEGTLRPRFNVIEQGSTPAIGSAAPRTKNRTVADVSDIAEIDSSSAPSADMHTMTIADAVTSGKPTLVLFAVPGFCESRLCGPEYEIMRKLYPDYKDKAQFIHVEFYENPQASNRVPVAAVKEWNLRTEPWFFVIDSKGIISAKFEGPTSLKELEDALTKVLPRAQAQ